MVWSGAAPARILAAETGSGAISLIAADFGELRATAPLVGVLPAGARIVHVTCVQPDGDLAISPVQLDDRLTMDASRADMPGLDLVEVRHGADGSGLVFETRTPPVPVATDAIAVGLNRRAVEADGRTRWIVGPFLEATATTLARIEVNASVGPDARGLTLQIAGPAGAERGLDGDILVAYATPAMRAAQDALAGMEPDLVETIEMTLDELATDGEGQADPSGLSPVAAFRRGFKLLRPETAGDGRTVLPDWGPDHDVVMLAAPHRSLVWTGEGEPATGSPMTVRFVDGGLRASGRRDAYAPSMTTELAFASASGGALVAASSKAISTTQDAWATAAERAAKRLWRIAPVDPPAALVQAFGSAGPSASMGSGRGVASQPGTPGPSRTSADASPASVWIDAALADDLSTRSLPEQVAMLLQSVSAPALTARAWRARVLLPLPGQGRTERDIATLLSWYEDPALPDRLARAAKGCAGDDRAAAGALQDLAASAHRVWLDLDEVADAKGLFDPAMHRSGSRPLTGLDALLAMSRRHSPSKPKSAPTLEALGRMRVDLPAAARQAGVSDEIEQELDRRLAELTPAEIVLLDGHFAGVLRQARQNQAAMTLIADWEAAAGLAGLAGRADRAGHVLAGARRLASPRPGFRHSIDAVASLSPALAWIDGAVTAALGSDRDGSLQETALQDTLAGYGRLLLLHDVLGQADRAFADGKAGVALSDPTHAGFGAAFRRLRHGTSDTLARYLTAAAMVPGHEDDWRAPGQPASDQADT